MVEHKGPVFNLYPDETEDGEFPSGAVTDTYEPSKEAIPTPAELDIERRFNEGEISLEEATKELAMLAKHSNL